MTDASQDHARRLRFALDRADTLIRAYALTICVVLLWVLFRHPHAASTRWIIGSFCIAAIYSAIPQCSSAKPVEREGSRDTD